MLAVAYEQIVIEEIKEEDERVISQINSALQRVAFTSYEVPPSSTTSETPASVVFSHFESAGEDCEFGFVQRQFGIEPSGLLQFSDISVFDLTEGLNKRFVGIASSGALKVLIHGREPDQYYMGQEQHYGLLYQTNIPVASIDIPTLHKQEEARLSVLSRKFIDEVKSGEKIFMLKSGQHLSAITLGSILVAFRSIGPATVIWIRAARGGKKPGTAEWLIPGLLAGYIDHLGTPPWEHIDIQSWLCACRAAYELWINQPDQLGQITT